MYYEWIDWISMTTFEFDGLIHNIAIMCSGYKRTTKRREDYLKTE